ncbi:helix-turn-helix domain-containing protein [Streptomyces sp. NPDC052236]|uniref:helix-turn-helix domain-containing protein n=1 Tax=Streptomyces sp. NPDC052236 TaxID=3365686 RepID=UPI0037CD4FFF
MVESVMSGMPKTTAPRPHHPYRDVIRKPEKPAADALGHLQVSVLRSGAGRAGVPAQLPAEDHDEALYLGLLVGGSVTVVHGGAEVVLEPGDLVFGNPAHCPFLLFGDHFQMTVFRIPRHRLGVAESDVCRVIGTPVPGGEGVGALVSNFLSMLTADAEFRSSRIGERLARNAVDLLAVLVMEILGEETADRSSAGTATLSRIRNFIEEHLTVQDLSPESIALAHHISVRYLHKLFQSEGTTVSHWIRRRRLDSCRHELGRSPNRRLTVAAVAHRWGFSSASHFSRVFRDAYGMSPSEWQALASSEAGSPTLSGSVAG